MRFDVLTIFPEMFPGPVGFGVVGRALTAGSVDVVAHNLRDWTQDRHRQVDDIAYGGGPGMVLKPEPIVKAVRELREQRPSLRTILMSPQGPRFTQQTAKELAQEENVLLICGRYQGVDERAKAEIGEELSVGDFILSGGELAAMIVIEAVTRLVPGVLGSAESLQMETFSHSGVEAPLYTRPADFEGNSVPAVLRGGDHAEIEKWRNQQSQIASEQRMRDRTSDLLRSALVQGGTQ